MVVTELGGAVAGVGAGGDDVPVPGGQEGEAGGGSGEATSDDDDPNFGVRPEANKAIGTIDGPETTCWTLARYNDELNFLEVALNTGDITELGSYGSNFHESFHTNGMAWSGGTLVFPGYTGDGMEWFTIDTVEGTLTRIQESAGRAVTTDGEHYYSTGDGLNRYDSLDDLYSATPAATMEAVEGSAWTTLTEYDGLLYVTGQWPFSEHVDVVNFDTRTVEDTIPIIEGGGVFYYGFSVTDAGMHFIALDPRKENGESDPPRLVRYDLETGEIIGEMWLPRSIAPVMTGLVCETEMK